MKRTYTQIHRELAALRRGEQAPARVYRVTLDEKGRPQRRELSPETFRRQQAVAWQREEAVEARRKLGLSQTEFARLLGISVRTLHNWEQGWRKPTGAARVLLKLAALNPRAVLEAAA
ncbi:MAG TPA: helix-turn-helix domain-containing protein [Verrucomicrobiae bacterium]